METKVCTKCNTEKDVTEFIKQPTGKYGVFSICKVCKNKLTKKWIEDNKEEVKRKASLYRLKNKEKKREYDKLYQKKYIIKNKKKDKERKKEYYQKNKEKILERNKNVRRKRYHSDEMFRCTSAIRSLIRKNIVKKGYSKTSRTFEILGCSYEEFKKHIESNWDDWMTWDNHGLYNGEEKCGWDLDHIVPVSSAQCEEDIYRLNHYSNIQPLCSYVNRNVKRDIVDWEL